MLKVFICENDPVQKEKLEKLIENYIFIEESDMEITLSTENPQVLLDYVEQHKITMGLYFLDIDLGHELTGISLGKKIRELDITGKIVFITTHGELMHLTFTYLIEAMDYIVKGSEFEEIERKVVSCLNVAHKRFIEASQTQESEIFVAKIGTHRKLIPLEDIMFFKTGESHKLVIHMKSGQLEFRGAMKEVLDTSNKFLRVHNSYVVNMDNIEFVDYNNRELKMTNGERCLISIKGLKDLSKKIALK